MAAKTSVLGLIMSSYPYLRSAIVRFSLRYTRFLSKSPDDPKGRVEKNTAYGRH